LLVAKEMIFLKIYIRIYKFINFIIHFFLIMPHYNPFRYGNPVPPEHFKGRKSELRRIIGRIVNAGESTSITGPFRCGKTSLLQYVSDSNLKSTLYGERSHQLIFSYLDVGTLGSEFDQAQFWSGALETFQDHINTGDIAPSLSEAYQIAQQNQFGNYVLEKLIAEIKKANLRLVLTLDGFDALLHHKVLNSTEFFGGIRQGASLSKGALALLITGNTPLTQLNQQTQHFNRTGSPYFNLGGCLRKHALR
jgi:ABC-type iron transport system FetAB ATPase subunit